MTLHLRKLLHDSRRRLDESLRMRMEDEVCHDRQIQDLQEQLDQETRSRQRSQKRLSEEVSSHNLSKQFLSVERASHDELHALHNSLRGARSVSSTLASKRTIPEEVSVIPTRDSTASDRDKAGGRGGRRGRGRGRGNGKSHETSSLVARKSQPKVDSRSPVDVSAIVTPATSFRLQKFVKDRRTHKPTVSDPVKTRVWGSDDQEYRFHSISPDKNPRLTIINGNHQKHRSQSAGTGEYLQLAGHLCLQTGQYDDDPADTPEWTPPPHKGFDRLSSGGDGDPNGDVPHSWHTISPEVRPLPICYGVDWTRNHVSPENNLGIRHPQDGTALPWLARYPDAGVRLFHPVVHPGGRTRSVEQLVGLFWESTVRHQFRDDPISHKTWSTTFPKYVRGSESASVAINTFLLDVESHCLSFGVYVPARETIMNDAQLGTLFTSLPIHVQVECADKFDILLYECFKKDTKLHAAFPTKLNPHVRSGYNIIYELAVLAQLPMLSLDGFGVVHTPPVVNDKDTIDEYTVRW